MRNFPTASFITLTLLLFSPPMLGFLSAQEITSPDTPSARTSQASPKPKYGDDTPESTIRSFYVALAMADQETVNFLLATPKELHEWVDAQLDITYAFHRFSEAAKSQFGDEGKSLILPSPSLIALNQLKDIKPKEDGDQAEWRTNPRLPMKLFRKDGHWKIDLLGSFEKAEHLQDLSREFARIAAYIDAIAEEIENGDIDTVEKVRSEMKRRRPSSSTTKQ